MDAEVGRLIEAATAHGMRIAVLSDYAFEQVSRPVFLNRALREAGLIRVQRAENGELLEPGSSTAFAVCDQQTAHVYVHDPSAVASVKRLLEDLDGVDRVMDRQQMRAVELDHPRAGELFVVAQPQCWFAYPYWLEASQRTGFRTLRGHPCEAGLGPQRVVLAAGGARETAFGLADASENLAHPGAV